MKEQTQKRIQAANRTRRVRAKLHGTKDKPRLTVNISNKHVRVQLIDDNESKTLAAYSSLKSGSKASLTEKAKLAGTEIAKLAKTKKIKQAILDRGSKLYHGRIKALADSAREEGLKI